MINPSELVLNLIEVYEIGNRVSMRIGRAYGMAYFDSANSVLNPKCVRERTFPSKPYHPKGL
jgi:hypothetical protein